VTREQQLSAVLSEFARTLVTDFPLQGILDHLITRIVEILARLSGDEVSAASRAS
jgi:hypothetical protein